ncbi:winged helix-turn-helix domain-containing protein [Pseudoalteromonas sp. SaAl2]
MTDFQKTFQLANLTVEPTVDQLSCNGRSIEIQSMAMKILCYLASRVEQLVTRDDLRKYVWNSSAVSDHSINNHIYSLRRSIAKLDPEKKYIHTVTGTNGNGYRLNALIYQKEISLQPELLVDNNIRSFRVAINCLRFKNRYSKFYLAIVIIVSLILLSNLYTYFIQSEKYSSITFVLTSIGRLQSPSISDNGKILLYSKRTAQDESWQLYASHIDNLERASNVFSSSLSNDNFASISPDQSRIAFVRYEADSIGIYLADFDSVKLKAKNAKLHITLPDANLSPSIKWLNNQQFFYNMKEDVAAPLKFFLYDSLQAQSEQISSPRINTQGDLFAAISPNKKWLAVMRSNAEEGYQIKLYNTVNREFVSIAIPTLQIRSGFSFSDNSKSIYFIDDKGYLARYDITAEYMVKVADKPYVGYWPIKVPGRHEIIMQQDWRDGSGGSQVVKYTNPLIRKGGTAEVIVKDNLAIRAIEEVGSGKLLFATITPKNKVQLWQYEKGVKERFVEFNEALKHQSPLSISWKKDTNSALLSINSTCRLINTKTGKGTPLCPDGETLHGGRYSRSGHELYFTTPKSSNSAVIRMGGAGYPFKWVTAIADAKSVMQSSTGDFYYSKISNNNIYRYTPKTEKHVKIISRNRQIVNNVINDFVLSSSGIYYLDRVSRNKSAVFFYGFKDKKIHKLIHSQNIYPAIAVSSDEQYLYLIQPHYRNNHLLILR